MRTLWICLALLFASCASGTTSTPAPSIADACGNLAVARCALLNSCTATVAVTVTYGDIATCQARQTAACVTNLSASGQNQTATTLQACADVAGTLSCSDRALNIQPDACLPPAGSIADGKPCIASGQCASTWCILQDTAVVGVCGALPKAGDSCETTSCGRGLECGKNAAGASICFAPVAAGGACDKDHHCGPDLACVGSTKTATGLCQARGAAVGTACDATNKTAADCITANGLFCDSTGHCKASTAAKPGDPCGAVGTDLGAYCTSGSCIKAATTDKAGVCKGDAADGAACDSDPSKGPGCLSPAKCVPTAAGTTAGVCTLPVAN